MSKSTRLNVFLFSFLLTSSTLADTLYSGHLKGLGNAWVFANDSVFYPQEGTDTLKSSIEMRLNLNGSIPDDAVVNWEVASQYQFADKPLSINSAVSPSDDTRFFDLTHYFHQSENSYSLIRLDRINLSYTSEQWVLRAGRQALSWGSGLMFSVMDIVNPFDGRVYDQEYKTGDDMLYLQYLQNNGNDFQVAEVYRRNPATGERNKQHNTRAVKYHGFINTLEFDLLAAEHYGDTIYALGLGGPLSEAVAHLEIRQTQTQSKNFYSGLAGISYSWVALEKNWTGVLEYYYDQAGLKGEFDSGDVEAQTYLVESALRGEKFLFGREYLGASSNIELNPLLNSALAIFYNTGDRSSLFQLSATYDWKQNLQIFGAISLPLGNQGSEFNGLEVNSGLYLSYEHALQGKIAWYF